MLDLEFGSIKNSHCHILNFDFDHTNEKKNKEQKYKGCDLEVIAIE